MSREELKQVAKALGIPLSKAKKLKSAQNLQRNMNLTRERDARPLQKYDPAYAEWYRKDDLVIFARASGIPITYDRKLKTKAALVADLNALHKQGQTVKVPDALDRVCKTLAPNRNNSDFLAMEMEKLHAAYQETRRKLAEAQAELERRPLGRMPYNNRILPNGNARFIQ